MNKRINHVLALVACTFISFSHQTMAQAPAERFECGTEALLEEGACVLSLFEIDVVVSSSGMESINTVKIQLGDAESEVSNEVDGLAYRAEIADINADQRPEVFVYISSAGSGSYGSMLGYVIDSQMNLVPINLPELGANESASAGYMGHDEFTVVETHLVRRFPLYKSGDVNAAPSGGHRNVSYQLTADGDSWSLKVSRIDDY